MHGNSDTYQLASLNLTSNCPCPAASAKRMNGVETIKAMNEMGWRTWWREC